MQDSWQGDLLTKTRKIAPHVDGATPPQIVVSFLLKWAAVVGLEISRAAERFGSSKAFTFFVYIFDVYVG